MAALKRRRISWIEALPAIATFGVVIIVGLAGGGFFPRAWRYTYRIRLSNSYDSGEQILKGGNVQIH